VDGVSIATGSEPVYILLNKPRGYTSTKSDPHAERTVMDLVRGVPAELHPVGRLDVDTEGLLILTNDGDFTYAVTHPSHQISKTYVATVTGIVTARELDKLQSGIELEDGRTAPAVAKLLHRDPVEKTSVVELIIREGKKRQVRRMFQALRHNVVRLVRVRIGTIEIGTLKPGAWRHLTDLEVQALLKASRRSMIFKKNRTDHKA
jgi:23S rRNA pseudouridine2605 synthase